MPLKSGKCVYVDKTFAPDKATAERIFEKAKKYGSPIFSSSALRFATELDEINKPNIIEFYDKDDNFIGLSYITAPLKQNDSSVIEYLIVNPEFQHKGYATRMVSSIINSENSEFSGRKP